VCNCSPVYGVTRDLAVRVAELLAYFDDTLPHDHPFRHLAAMLPGRPELPEPWLLGSSPQSALWAAQLGLPYAFADFINPGGAARQPELSSSAP